MDEQRILDQIEHGLASADPALATRMASFGAPRRIAALRMRRIRLVASLMTLLVVASVSLVVYALVPFRAVADRHAGSKASTPPTHTVMTAPSHPGQSPGQGSAAQTNAAQTGASPAGGAQASAAPASAAPARTALGTSVPSSSAASQAPSAHAGTSASPASAHQQPRAAPSQ